MTLAYTYWREPDGWLLGYFNAYPEHITQAKTVEELEYMLKDLYELMKLDTEKRFETPLQQGELAFI